MPKNPLAHHEVDIGQIHRRVFDPENDALRMVFNDLYLDINANKDSIIAIPPNLSAKASINANTAPGDVISPISCIGIKNINLYSKDSLDHLKTSISPSDEDNVWFLLDMPAKEVNARRIKVELTNIATKEYDIYLVGA